ncbi:MAG: four helix bundle protein [Bdellovibrionota bacterium]
MTKFFTLELAVEFYEISKDLRMPAHLKSQYLRACSSIALNLSEGSAKPTLADRRRFYFIALGSFRECQTILRLHGQTQTAVLKKSDFLGACLYKLCQAVK